VQPGFDGDDPGFGSVAQGPNRLRFVVDRSRIEDSKPLLVVESGPLEPRIAGIEPRIAGIEPGLAQQATGAAPPLLTAGAGPTGWYPFLLGHLGHRRVHPGSEFPTRIHPDGFPN
jgi:hypothetical protein